MTWLHIPQVAQPYLLALLAISIMVIFRIFVVSGDKDVLRSWAASQSLELMRSRQVMFWSPFGWGGSRIQYSIYSITVRDKQLAKRRGWVKLSYAKISGSDLEVIWKDEAA